jgi:hypothetical protein
VFILGVFNIILGASFLFGVDQARFTTPLLIVNDIFTFKVWGLLFIGLGILKLYSLLANKWELARQSLIVGVLVKATWAVALTIRSLVSPGTLFVNFIWIALALIQMVTYIFFMPPNIQPVLKRSEGEVLRDA